MRTTQGVEREAAMRRVYCDEDDCLLPAERGPKCRGHAARAERGKVRSGPLRERLSSWQQLHAAALALADADAEDDAEYHRAEQLFRYHGRRYFCPPDCPGKGCGRSRGD